MKMNMNLRKEAVASVRKKMMGHEKDRGPSVVIALGSKGPGKPEPDPMDDEDTSDEGLEGDECGMGCDDMDAEQVGEASTDDAAKGVPPTALKKLIEEIVDARLKGMGH